MLGSLYNIYALNRTTRYYYYIGMVGPRTNTSGRSTRLTPPSPSTRSNKQQQLKKAFKISYYPIEKGLKSEATVRQYKWHFDTFLKWVALKYGVATPQRLLQFEIKELEKLLIEYLDDYMHGERHRSHSMRKTAMAAVMHFCDINDVYLNRRKIGKFIPPDDENHQPDRAYTHDEIQTLYANADKRFKVIILLLANGLRIGAIPDLEIRDLEEMKLPGQPRIYKIWVYARSKNHKYYTFVTPECTKAIDDYREFREGEGERNITVGTNSSSPLIREQFELGNRALASKPRKMSLGSIEKTFERIVKRSGIGTKGEVMMSHGCRKWAITQMIKSKVDFEIREYLVGHRHSRGVTGESYDRLDPEDRLDEWKKAINNLTIDKSLELKRELEVAKGETAYKIAELQFEIDRNRKATEHIMTMLEAVKPALDAKSKAAALAFKSVTGSSTVL